MLVKDILRSRSVPVSFEFFPPKTEPDWEKLFASVSNLMPLEPAYVSVTYGAGGSTRSRTHRLVTRIQRETDLTVVAHLTCTGSTRKEIWSILEKYEADGVENILALRGDPREGDNGVGSEHFQYAAELVAFIKTHFPHMGVGVAGFPEGHPGTPNRLQEIEHLKAKVDCGADLMVTQLFFDNRDYFDFCERCELAGVRVPIIAGIMPITSVTGMHRMAELAAGARIPASLLRAIARAEGRKYVRNVGIHWAAEQVRDLVDNGVPGIHLYTLNNSHASLSICDSLGLRNYLQLEV